MFGEERKGFNFWLKKFLKFVKIVKEDNMNYVMEKLQVENVVVLFVNESKPRYRTKSCL